MGRKIDDELYNQLLAGGTALLVGIVLWIFFGPHAAWGSFIGIAVGITLRRDFMR